MFCSTYAAEALGSGAFDKIQRASVLLRMASSVRCGLLSQYRSAYKKALTADALDPCEELLVNDFYLLEKQLVQLMSGLESIRSKKLPSNGIPRIYFAAERCVNSFSAVLTAEGTEDYFVKLQQSADLTLDELCILPLCLKLALCTRICNTLKGAEACKNGQSPELCCKNALLSMQRLDDAHWDELIESISPVNRILSARNEYLQLSRQSRRCCLERVKRIALSLKLEETKVACAAAALADNGGDELHSHVGFYLCMEGENELRILLSPQYPKLPLNNRTRLFLFLASITVFSAALLATLAHFGLVNVLLGLYPAVSIALSLVSYFASLTVKPRCVLRKEPDPADCEQTAVAVPVLLDSVDSVNSSVRRLETHYLANPIDGVKFILLADLPDDQTAETEKDSAVINAAKEGVRRLDQKYGERFYLLMRSRTRRADGVFSGFERKRGAVMELCALLLGKENGSGLVYPAKPLRAEYLAVLDSDTVLPHGTLKKLIGAASLGANRAVVNNGRLTRGSSVFVPNMRTTAASSAKSAFAGWFGGDNGTELYSESVSNLHMDLYGSGDFGGKGIICIEPFYTLLKDAIPQNTVLSHDLLEGSISGAAFLNDVTLYDDQPSTLPKWWRRQERWIRGDWQLLPFIAGAYKKALHGALPRVKMLGNIFRSLREPAALSILLISAAFGLNAAFFASLIAFLFEPVKCLALLAVKSLRGKQHFAPALVLAVRSFTELITLPYGAYYAASAVIKALWRMLVSHKNMLQWQPGAASSENEVGVVNAAFAALLAGLTAVSLSFSSLGPIQIASILLSAAWLTARPIIRTIDRQRKRFVPDKRQKAFLQTLFAGAWRFFDDNCTQDNNFLPPDNIQEYPLKPAADRTSPTNIGMALMAFVSAYDVGVIDKEELIKRTSGLLNSLHRLQKWNGCPYNWYNILTLSPLGPRFVSSVDCGNLLASLMVAEDAMLALGAVEAAEQCRSLIDGMQIEKLYDPERELFYVGYDADAGAFTGSHYDLYASEARILSFTAIALDRVPARHWQRLSRIIRIAEGGRVMLSWSGTAFEYLMPLIFFNTVGGSLQHEICLSAVRTQILSAKPGAPWGTSECGYYCFDEGMYYRYHAFGLPRLGLEPLHKSRSITAPYAAALALYSEPEFALEDLSLLNSLGCTGKLGMYEALDHSAGDAVVKSYMAHHKGMELCAYAAALTGKGIAARFMRLPQVRAHEELLFEHMPIRPIVIKRYENSIYRVPKRKSKALSIRTAGADPQKPQRAKSSCGTSIRCDGQLLSNGSYSVHAFADGSSDSYLINGAEQIGMTASSGVKILFSVLGGACIPTDRAEFMPNCVRYYGYGGGVRTTSTVTVAANANAEIRRTIAVNTGPEPVTIRAGIVFRPMLTEKRAYCAHPAFIKLMTQAEMQNGAVLFHLRSRKSNGEDTGVWQYAAVISQKAFTLGTDETAFPGRLCTPESALAQGKSPRFKNYSPDPCFAAAAETELGGGEAFEFTFILGAAASKERALEAVNELRATCRGSEQLCAAIAAGMMRNSGIEPEFAAFSEPLAARIALGIPFKPRALSSVSALPCGVNGRQALWGLGVSGDLPVLLIEAVGANDGNEYKKLNDLLAFCRYCSARGLLFDTVLLLNAPYTYGSRLRSELNKTAADTPRVHIVSAEVEASVVAALRAAALIVCTPDTVPYSAFDILLPQTPKSIRTAPADMPQLADFNGYGGFSAEDREYVILHGPKPTPAPWCNIIANPRFGFVVSEKGGGFTWYNNSRLMRLTPWDNDPMTDAAHERVYIKEHDSALFITPAGMGGKTVHGTGYSEFICSGGGLSAEMTVFADASEPVKYYLVRVKNSGFSKRSIKVRLEVDWSIGESPSAPPLISARRGTIEACGALNELNGMCACVSAESADQRGAEVSMELSEGEERETVFVMSAAPCGSQSKLLAGYVSADAAHEALNKVRREWNKRLGTITCKTTDDHFDRLVNGLLLYQTYSSRLFARTGYYQNGGAAGFRDELQDVTALLLGEPERAKNAILSAAANQFPSGDVLHWRHENGFGVRTRISDDRLFLPYAAIEYALVTGDDAIWSEYAPYLKEEPIPEGRKDLYSHFASEGGATLIEHCIAAIDSALVFGQHGLPLMAGGDWNDGMDNVGAGGGESCFLGWMLVYVLERFCPFLQSGGYDAKAEMYEKTAKKLRDALEKHAWVGDRYLRAFYADGTPLGAAGSNECAIDAVAQCWPVFCGAEHKQEAFDSMLKLLADEQSCILRLLDPPFNGNGGHFAGYIENYVPGVRENGGQYTHAAVWALIAACRLGRGEDAQKLFELLDPIRKGSRDNIERYMAEPYALAGDVYSGENAGRAGWTWYTGAAAWLYRAATEYMLGIKKRGERLYIEPVNGFAHFTAEYKYGDSVYAITAKRTGERSLTLDGRQCEYVLLTDDGARHEIEVTY